MVGYHKRGYVLLKGIVVYVFLKQAGDIGITGN